MCSTRSLPAAPASMKPSKWCSKTAPVRSGTSESTSYRFSGSSTTTNLPASHGRSARANNPCSARIPPILAPDHETSTPNSRRPALSAAERDQDYAERPNTAAPRTPVSLGQPGHLPDLVHRVQRGHLVGLGQGRVVEDRVLQGGRAG